MKRRSFFQKFAAVVAAVALAPEIAFNVRLKERLSNWALSPFWHKEIFLSCCYSDSYRKYLATIINSNAYQKFISTDDHR